MASPSPTRAESPNKPRSTSPRHRSHTSPTLVDPELVRRSIGQSAVAMTSWMTDRTHCHPAFPPVTRLEQEREGHTAIVRSRKVHDRARSVLDGIYGKKKEEPAPPPPPEPAKERSVTPDGAQIPAVGPKEEEQPAPPPPQPTEAQEQPEKKQEAPSEPAAAPAPVEQQKERAAPPPAAPFPFEGSMYKFAIGKSATGRKNWKERWFTFDNKGLSYSEEKGSKALGTIPVFEASAKAAFVAVPSKAMHDACDLPGREVLVCFDEEGKRLKLLLRCNTEADKAKWVDVFRAKLTEHTQA